MKKWIIGGCAGCLVVVLIGVALVGTFTYMATSAFREIQARISLGQAQLEVTNAQFPFTEPGTVDFASESYARFFAIRQAWNQTLLQRLPVERLKSMQSGEDVGAMAVLSLAKEVAQGIGPIGTLLADSLTESEMSYDEFRWHTGNLLAALSAEPPVSQEVSDIYRRMTAELANLNTAGRQGATMTASELEREFGFRFDPATFVGAETLAANKDLIHKPNSFILIMDVFALKGSLDFNDPSMQTMTIEKDGKVITIDKGNVTVTEKEEAE